MSGNNDIFVRQRPPRDGSTHQRAILGGFQTPGHEEGSISTNEPPRVRAEIASFAIEVYRAPKRGYSQQWDRWRGYPPGDEATQAVRLRILSAVWPSWKFRIVQETTP